MGDKKLPTTVKEAKELLKLYEKIKEAGEDYVDLPAAEEAKLEKLTTFVTANAAAYDQLLAKQEAEIDKLVKYGDTGSSVLKKARKEWVELGKIKEQLDKQTDFNRKTLEKYAKALKNSPENASDEYKKLSKALEATSLDVARFNLKASDVAIAMLGTGKTGVEALKTSWIQYMKTMDDGLVDYTAKTGLYTKALLDSQVSAIGPYIDLNGELREQAHLITEIGLTGKDAGEAFQGLTSHVSMLRTRLHDVNYRDQIDQVSNTMMALKKLGVSYEVSGKNIDIFTRGLKQTPLMATESMKRLDGLADSLKINVNQAITDFNTLAPTLLAYGDRAIDVFAGMEAQAQATGIAVSELDGLAAKFDTFEGAANAAGRLNAVLGNTHLSVMDLVHADPAEKFEMIKEAVASAGVAFEDMDRRQKDVIANALNMNTEQASRLFGSQEDFKMAGDAMDTNATEADELTIRINRAMDSTALLKKSWSELAQPIRDYTETLRAVTNTMGKVPTKLMKDLIESLGGNSDDVKVRTNANKAAIATSGVLLDMVTKALNLKSRIPGVNAFTKFGLLGLILGEEPDDAKKRLEKIIDDVGSLEDSTNNLFSGPNDPSYALSKLNPVRDGLHEVARAAKGLTEIQPFSFLTDLDDTATKNMRNVLRQSSAFLRSIERAPAGNIEHAKELFAELAELPLNVNLQTAANLTEPGSTGTSFNMDPSLQRDMSLANLGPVHVTLRTENTILARAVMDGMSAEMRARLAGR